MGVPNPFNITVEEAPQFTNTGISGYAFRENTYKRSAFNNVTIDDNATKVIGKHQLMFGVHYRRDQLNVLPDQTWQEGLMNFGSNATALYDPASTPTSPL